MKTLLLGLLITTSAWAGKFEIIGEGVATRAADFIRVDILVQGECHTSALSARQSVDDLATKAVAVLGKFKAAIPDQLIVSPGANLQKIKTDYVDNVRVTICDESHSWTATTLVQFKLLNQNQLADLQDALLVLNPKSILPTATNVERLSLSLAKPTPGVLADSWNEMSDLALERAHQNALRQVKVLTTGMAHPKIELAKVTAVTTGSSGQLIYDQVSSEGDSSGEGLGSVSVKLARLFTFKVEEP